MPYCRKCGYTAGAGESDCRICGQALAPGEINAAPQTPATASVPSTATGNARPAPLMRRLLAIGVPSAAAILAGFAFGAHYFHTVPTLEQLVPRDAAGVAAVDAHWWWDASTDVRAQPEVRDAIRDFEKETKVSLENDVVPWVGQVGVAGWNSGGKNSTGVAYLQVRDWPAFLRFAHDMKQRASDSAGNKWEETTYNGVKIETLEVSGDTPMFAPSPSINVSASTPSVTLAYVKGWVLLGVGKAGVEHSIDTYQGRTPSLEQYPTWAKALALRPKHWFAWGGFGSKEFASALKPLVPFATGGLPSLLGVPDSVSGVLSSDSDRPASPATPSPEQMLDKMAGYDFVGIGVASDTGNGLRFDAYGVAGSEQVKTLWHDLKGTSGGVTGDILAQLPKDSAMAFLAHDPAGWWNRYKKAILAAAPSASRKTIEDGLREIGPAEDVIQSYPGDCGLALTYHEDKGFGAVFLAQGKNPQAVRDSSHELGDYLKAKYVKLRWTGDQATLTDLASETPTPELPFAPVFGAHDDYFAAATSPIWLDASTERGAGLTLPEDARGADAIFLGDFRMLPSLLSDMAKQKDTDPKTLRALRDTGLETAHWDAFTRIEADGSMQQSTWEIDGWNWREALRHELTDVRDTP